jgi:hypothetical protein
MTEFTTRDGTQMFYKDWDAGPPIVRSHGSPVLLISHITGCAWTVHPIGAR